jgi:hypothetical protein
MRTKKLRDERTTLNFEFNPVLNFEFNPVLNFEFNPPPTPTQLKA